MKRRLDWLGHVIKVDQTRVAKKMFESKPECKKAKAGKAGRCRE
jgi:hypothetical protein